MNKQKRSDKEPRATHTPTPWKVSKQAGFISVGPLMVTGHNQEEDAAFIVRAVNAHDELLRALKEAQKVLRDVFHAERACINQAIAKAEGMSASEESEGK